LFCDGFDGAAAFVDIAEGSAEQPEIGGGIDEDFELDTAADFGHGEQEDAFDQEYRLWVQRDDGAESGVSCEIIDRLLNGDAAAEQIEMFDEQQIIEGIGVIPIAGAVGEAGEQIEVPVVGIVAEAADLRGERTLQESPNEGGFAGTAAAGDSENESRLSHIGSVDWVEGKVTISGRGGKWETAVAVRQNLLVMCAVEFIGHGVPNADPGTIFRSNRRTATSGFRAVGVGGEACFVGGGRCVAAAGRMHAPRNNSDAHVSGVADIVRESGF
jgi:hypothetical protein